MSGASVQAAAPTANMVEMRCVSRSFVEPLSAAASIFRLLGAKITQNAVHALDGVDLAIPEGKVVGLVGESGCGKSTLGRVITGIIPPSAGEVAFNGKPLPRVTRRERAQAASTVQMVFQNPFASLNPRMRIGKAIGQAPRYHGLVPGGDIDAYVDAIMVQVGLDPSVKDRLPHQFSGGQRQRIGIARALAMKPRVLVCDEVVAALDVSIQAQILNLFMKLRADLGLTSLFISHDLSVVRHISDRVAVMYLGRIVETGTADDLFQRANHPYTQALLAEANRFEIGRRRFAPVKGEIPSPLAPPPGCSFHPRCPRVMPQCRIKPPQLRSIAPGHASACYLNGAV